MSSKGSVDTVVPILNLSIQKIYANGNRSLFTTYDNKIYIGGKSFSMNSLTTYEYLCQIEKQIRTISLGREHCLVQDGKYLLYHIY